MAFGIDNDIQLAAMVDAKNRRFMSLSPVMISTDFAVLARRRRGRGHGTGWRKSPSPDPND
jgi:ribose 1,5-bisphosphokinase PhnN